MADAIERLLTASQLSEMTGRPPGWFAKARCTGSGPRFVKLGGRVMYRQSAVLEWIAECERVSTSERRAG